MSYITLPLFQVSANVYTDDGTQHHVQAIVFHENPEIEFTERVRRIFKRDWNIEECKIEDIFINRVTNPTGVLSINTWEYGEHYGIRLNLERFQF